MRDFIKVCALLFVGLGALVFIVPAALILNSFSSGETYSLEWIGLLLAIPIGASIALIGGGTYVVCNIDARLEKMSGRRPAKRALEG